METWTSWEKYPRTTILQFLFNPLLGELCQFFFVCVAKPLIDANIYMGNHAEFSFKSTEVVIFKGSTNRVRFQHISPRIYIYSIL
jgi:hypothetical protein